MSEFKDKIKEFVRLRPNQIVPHPLNYKDHTETQRKNFRAILGEVGIAGAILVMKLKTGKNKGKYQIIGGHMRAEEITQPIPALVLDVTPKEATELLARLDAVAELADTNESVMAELLDTIGKAGKEFKEALALLCPTMEPGFGEAFPGEPQGDWIQHGEDIEPGEPAKATRQVPLVFTAKQKAEFLKLADKLNTTFKTDNYSDCVLAAFKAWSKSNAKAKR